jgi:hypothetical protein
LKIKLERKTRKKSKKNKEKKKLTTSTNLEFDASKLLPNSKLAMSNLQHVAKKRKEGGLGGRGGGGGEHKSKHGSSKTWRNSEATRSNKVP